MELYNHLICQSCWMPMKKDKDLGKNEDWTKNKEYCVFCIHNGIFTDDGITLEERINKSVKIAISLWVLEEEARKTANDTIPNLKRWKN